MLCCVFLCVQSSFAIILMGKRKRACCFALFVFLVSRECCAVLPHGAMGLSAVCDCGIPDHTHFLFFTVPERTE